MTGAGRTMRIKRHHHIITPRDHTMANVTARAAKLQAKQSKDPNMINAGKVHTPQRMRGTNGAASTAEGATVTPLTTKHNIATSGQNEEEGSTNGEAHPAVMDVDAPATADKETVFSLPAAKGNMDANIENDEDGSTNGKARPETMDVETATADGEAQAGKKRTRDTEEEGDLLAAFSRRTTETARKIKEKKKKGQM